MRIDIVSIFPAYLDPLRLSLVGKAVDAGLVAQGKQAFATHACASCHRLDGAEPVALKVPDLKTLAGKDGAANVAGCLGQKSHMHVH